MAEESLQLPHGLTLNARSKLTMTGVSEVVSFDENAVVLHTSAGILSIHGQQLQLKQLSPDGGRVVVDGRISALIYEEPRSERSWLQRLLK